MAAIDEVLALIASVQALGGVVNACYDARTGCGVQQSGGTLSAWDDVRGAVGFGPSFTVGTAPSYDSTNQYVTTNGTTQYFETAASALFSLTNALGFGITFIGEMTGSGYDLGVYNATDGTFARYWAFNSQASNWATKSSSHGTLTTPVAKGATRRLANLIQGATSGRAFSGDWYRYVEVRGRLGIASHATNATSSPAAAFTAGDNVLSFGRLATTFSTTKLRFILVWGAQPTAEMLDLVDAFAAASHGVTISTSTPSIRGVGNSIVFGVAASTATGTVTPHADGLGPWLCQMLGTPTTLSAYDAANRGVSSRTGATIAATLERERITVLRGRTDYCIYHEITNDITGGLTATQCLDNVKAYCDAMRARGAKVIVVACLPRGGWSAGQEAVFAAVNAALANPASAYYAGSATARGTIAHRFAAVHTITGLDDHTNATYYADESGAQVHPTDAGHALIGTGAAPAVRAVFDHLAANLPAALAAVVISLGEITGNSVALSWSASTDGENPYTYAVQYGLGASPSSWTTFASGLTDTTSTVTGLSSGQLYTFRVVTTDYAGATATSGTASGTPNAVSNRRRRLSRMRRSRRRRRS